jgi:hypothetical protein
MLFEEGAKHTGQNVLGHGHGGTDTQGARGLTVGAVDGSAGFLGETRAFASVAEEDDAGIGKADAAFAAVEEGDGQFLFEGVNLLANRGLAEVETLGRAAEAGFFGDGAEDLEPEILHAAFYLRPFGIVYLAIPPWFLCTREIVLLI